MLQLGSDMTSIAVWVGVDSRGPASLHVATDSRVSWGDRDSWDHCSKSFASTTSPDTFSFCGDVLYPSLLLSQFVAALDAGAFGLHSSERFHSLEALARDTFLSYPKSKACNTFSVVHCARDGEGMASQFHVNVLHWSQQSGWIAEQPKLPTTSSHLVIRLGSGIGSMKAAASRWEQSPSSGTSRAVFSAFVDSLLSGHDIASGGSPQLVSLFRIGGGMTSGTIFSGQRFVGGLPISSEDVRAVPRWFNEYFELCDGESMKRKPDAQIHEKS